MDACVLCCSLYCEGPGCRLPVFIPYSPITNAKDSLFQYSDWVQARMENPVKEENVFPEYRCTGTLTSYKNVSRKAATEIICARTKSEKSNVKAQQISDISNI
jgi:hypothetical protein